MAKLTSKQRKSLPTSTFALPKERAYPIPDRSHAIAAKSRATQFATPAQKKVIDAKANKMLGKDSRGDTVRKGARKDSAGDTIKRGSQTDSRGDALPTFFESPTPKRGK